MLRRRLSVRTVLLLISLTLLILPLGSLYFLRIYQSALIRQTESELISQAAFVAAIYRDKAQNLLAQEHPKDYGAPASQLVDEPVTATLDLARDQIYPPRPLPQSPKEPPETYAMVAGAQIVPILREVQRVTLSGMKILDSHGIVVAGQEELGLSFAHTPEFQMAMTGRPVTLLRQRRMPEKPAPLNSLSRNATVNVFAAWPVIHNNRVIGVVWLNRTPPDITQTLYGKRRELSLAAGVLFIAALLIAALTSLTVTQPIRGLVHKNRLIAKGHPDGLLPLKNPITREIAELSDSISLMAKTLQHRAEYIRNFAAHVSHEFKTPLTGIQGSVELLSENLREMPLEQQQRFLANIAEDTHRLNLLVSRLLQLAQADMAEPFRATIEVMPVLKEVAARFLTESFVVTVESEEMGEISRAAIRLESLEAVIGILLENSLQNGASTVGIALETTSSLLEIRVQDNGPGISEGNQPAIFTPFFTTRRSQGGTGLGLSIAQSLLERHHGRISLEQAGHGACFLIELPRA